MPVLATATPDSSLEIARLIGYHGFLTLIVVVLLAGMWFAFSRKPEINRKSILSLMLVLGGWLVLILAVWVGPSVASPLFAVPIVLVGIGMAVAGIVLAIIGLVESGKGAVRPKGRGRAITALMLGLPYLGIFAVSIVVALIGAAVTSNRPAVAPAAGEVVTLEEFNLRYRSPGGPYVSYDFKKTSPAAKFGLLRTNPQVYFTIVAERNSSVDLDTAGLAQISKAHLRSGDPGATISEEVPRRINGLDDILFYSDVSLGGAALSYAHWVVAHNGYYYQFIVWGYARNREQVRREADMLFARFELIDPLQQAGPPVEAFGSFTSPFGYTVDLKGTSWSTWPDMDKNMALAEVGGRQKSVACFVVAPFFYDGERPVQEALNKALLSVLEIDPSDRNLTKTKPLEEAGMQGQAFDFFRDSDGTPFDFRIKVLAGPRYAYFVAVWAKKGGASVDTLAAEVFSRVRFPAEQPAQVNVAGLPERQRNAQAALQNRLGQFYYKTRQYDKALVRFQKAAELNRNDVDFLGNALNAFHRLGRHEEALAFLDGRFAALADNEAIRSWKALHLKALDRTDEAGEIFRKLFAEGYSDDEDFTAYIGMLTAAKRWEDAQAAFDAYLKKHDSTSLRVQQAQLFRKQGKHADAVAALKALQKGRDYSTEIAYALIHNYNAMEQPKEALALCDEMIAKGFASADAYYLKGEAEYGLKWYRQAKESYTKALALSPRDEEIQKALRDVSGLLGEGDNTSIRNAIDPVPLPKTLADQLPPVTARGVEGYGAFYLSDVTAYAFLRGKDLRRTSYMRVKVLDAGGVSRFSTLEMDFDPLSEEAFVNELLVRDGEGKVVSRGQLADYYVIDRQKSDAASHDRTVHMPVPHLQPGYVVELTLTIRCRGEPKEFNFREEVLRGSRPRLLAAIWYRGDPAQIRHKSVRGPQPQAVDGGLLWIMKDVPAFQTESLQPDYDLLLPIIYLGDAGVTWESEAADYLKRISDKVVLDDQTRGLAKDLTRQVTDRSARIAVLANYVQRSITYKAIEFGRRAQVPNKPQDTVAHLYGDCKDHAVLLQQLLAAVGIPSHLALVGHGVLQEDLPSLDQFNHMIVYVPEEGGCGRFIDTTSKGMDLTAPVAWDLGGHRALVLDSARPVLRALPAYAAGASAVCVERAVEVLADRTVRVRETVVAEGFAGAALREHFKGMDAAKHTQWAQSMIADYVKTASVKSLRVSDVDDNAKPLTAELTYEVRDGAQKSGDDLVVRLPDAWEREYLGIQPMKRQEPFEIRCPFSFEGKANVTAPPGYALVLPPAPAPQGECPGARWQAAAESKAGACTLRMNFQKQPGTFPAEQYDAYHRVTEQAIGAMAREVRCRPQQGVGAKPKP